MSPELHAQNEVIEPVAANIVIHASAELEQYIHPQPPLDAVQTVAGLIAALGLASRGGVIVLVNDRLAGPQTILVDGDVVQLVPAIAGG